MGTRLETLAGGFFKARSLNATDTSFPARTTLGADPILGQGGLGQSVFSTIKGVDADGLSVAHNALFCVPYGTGDDNDVFAMRVIGWRPLGSVSVGTNQLWIATIIAELTCTLSAAVGLAGATLLATERLCDTIVLVTGNDDVDISIVNPANDTPAHFTVDFKGSPRVEFTFDMTTGDPSGGNCLVAYL